MGCVEHDSAHLQVEIASLTLMCGGCAAISRRLQEKKKLRLLVEEADLQPPKAACKNLRARAYGRRQQLTPASEGIRQASAANIQTTCAPWPAKPSVFAMRIAAAAAASRIKSLQQMRLPDGNLNEELGARICTSWSKMTRRKGATKTG